MRGRCPDRKARVPRFKGKSVTWFPGFFVVAAVGLLRPQMWHVSNNTKGYSEKYVFVSCAPDP